MLAGGVAGAVLALYGLVILVTGRAPETTAKAFRSVRDAGFYHFLFGTAVGLVVIATGIDNSVVNVTISVLAVITAGVALVRFRPRGRRNPVNR